MRRSLARIESRVPAALAVSLNTYIVDETAERVRARSFAMHDDSLEANMAFFHQDIVTLARSSTDFRREILTQSSSQVVIMSVAPGDDIGEETHGVDQLLFFIDGRGDAVLNGERSAVSAGSLVAVPAGTRHNFINTGPEPLKLFTIYAPPEEEPGTLHRTKADAVAAANP